MNKQFSIGNVLNEAWSEIQDNFVFYLQLNVIFLVSSFILGFVLGIILAAKLEIVAYIVGAILFTFLTMKLAILTHRAVLLKEYRLSNMSTWQEYDKKFLVWVFFSILFMLGIGFILVLLGYPTEEKELSTPVTIFFFIVVILLSLMFSRLGLVFPDAATNGNMRLKEAWERTKPYAGSLFILVIIIPGILNKIAEFIPQTNLVTILFSAFILIFISIFQITIISICYKLIFDPNDDNNKHQQEKNPDSIVL